MNVKMFLEKDGFTLAALTAYMYLVAFIVLFTKAKAYGLPFELMSLSVMQLTRGAMVIFLTLALYSTYLTVMFKMFDSDNVFVRMFSNVVWGSMPFALLTYMFRGHNPNYIGISLISIVFLSVAYLSSSRRIFSFMGYGVRDKNPVLTRLFKKVKDGGTFMCVFYGLILAAFLVVTAVANFQTYLKERSFDVFEKEGYFAIVNYSTDIVLAKKIKGGKLIEGFFIFKPESLENFSITKRDITTLPDLAPSGSPATPARRASLR